MSTPTSSATIKSLGDCVICGESCTLKCSECARYGTDWMFFCGQEHQKLIWPFHKRVCGKNSNPFKWPSLTDREVEETIELSTAKVLPPIALPGELESWFDKYSREVPEGIDPEQAFKFEIYNLRDPEVYTTVRLQSSRADRIVYFRYFAALVHHFSTKDTSLPEMVIAGETFGRLFNYLISIQVNVAPDIAYNTGSPSSDGWWTKFQHLFLIHRLILPLLFQDPSKKWLRAAFRHTHQEMKRFVDEVTATNHPATAATSLRRLVETEEEVASVERIDLEEMLTSYKLTKAASNQN